MVGDGTSISVGKPSRGRIIDGVRLPDTGEGFFTREVWSTRGNRYGTDELVDLITAVSRRLLPRTGQRLVVADLSGMGGGAARLWHRSHQSGRDVDLLYFVRDAEGKPTEADAMRRFNPRGVARDGSGVTVDIERTWLLVRELVTAPEAPVQWVFMYEPIAARVLEHAIAIHEPEHLIARARRALKQPGDSAPHDDHVHVRVYCSRDDRAYGCVDVGPMELLAEREAELEASPLAGLSVASAATGGSEGASPPEAPGRAAAIAGVPMQAGGGTGESSASAAAPDLNALGRLLRTRSYRVDLRRGR